MILAVRGYAFNSVAGIIATPDTSEGSKTLIRHGTSGSRALLAWFARFQRSE